MEANNYHDAYRGARDDLLEWKNRALQAEESCRRLTAALNAENGPTFMGEPALARSQAQGEPVAWKRLTDDDRPDAARRLDVVLWNGVTLTEKHYTKIDWSAVIDWRYSPAQEGGA